MTSLKSVADRLKNGAPRRRRGDFGFSFHAFLFMFALGALGLAVLGFAVGALPAGLALRTFIAIALAALLYGALPYWGAGIAMVGLAGFILGFAPGAGGLFQGFAYGDWPGFLPLAGLTSLVIFLGPCLQVVAQWDKAVILRMGKFRGVRGPGVFFLLPLAEKYADLVDTRIRVSDFSAEKILTRDTVPIDVDALAFWMIWDAQKAVLEVENFLEAITLSAQTALRDSVGKYSLSTLLSERETLYREIQAILDAKTNPWGITILSVEFVDIQLPKDLEDVMSRVAQAEREKKARLLLAESEQDIAQKYVEAARIYAQDPSSLKLRSMSMVYDAMKTRGSVVLVPSTSLNDMDLGSMAAAANLAKPSKGSPQE